MPRFRSIASLLILRIMLLAVACMLVFGGAHAWWEYRKGQQEFRRSMETLVANSMISLSAALWRSEEHTSELQSPCNLVCRLLLEKKKQQTPNAAIRDSQRAPALLRHTYPLAVPPHCLSSARRSRWYYPPHRL